MEKEAEKLRKEFIFEVHAIAKYCPEILDEILTDKVLVWCLTDIDECLSNRIDICLGLENNFNSPDYDLAKKPMCRALFESTKRELKEYYDLFLVYDNIRKKRNISLKFTPTVDKSSLKLQHILEPKANKRHVLENDVDNKDVNNYKSR